MTHTLVERYKHSPPRTFSDPQSLSEPDARHEIEALREAINYHDVRYYVNNDPAIADAAYDRLRKRLEHIEERFPRLRSPGSPTMRVGAKPQSRLRKVRHQAPLLSLSAASEEQEIRSFLSTITENKSAKTPPLVAEPKFDGFSVEIVYRDGVFDHGSTRGDGESGEDISANLKTVRSMPLRLTDRASAPSLLAVRGEVYLPRAGFIEINQRRIERGETPFANPRNAAAGLMRQLDSRNVAHYPLDIIFYELIAAHKSPASSHWKLLAQFSRWGLKTDAHNKRVRDIHEISRFRRRLIDQRDDLPYEIDGIVIKADDFALRSRLGTRQRSPRWALAWKFPPRQEVTTLRSIVVQVGKTGMLTPVGLLDPVDVGGVTVSRATLHNEDEVHRKDVRPGDTVRVVRAGDVIPEIIERLPRPGRRRPPPFSMPARCPVSDTPVVREGAYIFCPAGLACRAQLVGRIIHFASREALDIAGLGEKTVSHLVESGAVSDMADLYRLSVDDIKQLPLFAQKAARNLHAAIQRSRRPRLDRFIYGLGIRYVGERTARMLAREFSDLQSLRRASVGDIEAIEDIGLETARAVHEFFANEDNQRVLERLARAGVKPAAARSRKKSSALAGKTFVFTGSLDHFSRREAKELVESMGARASSSVSGATDYVVAGSNPGSKFDQARNNGASIIDEHAFMRLINA